MECKAVEERDLITVLDAANDEVIWMRVYYDFRVENVYKDIEAYFAKKAAK